MADNVDITAGSGTTIATDQIGSAHYQKVKLAFGVADSATLVSSSDGLPVNVLNASMAVTGTFWQATQPVSAASLPLPTGASTEATLSTLNGKVTACNTGAVTIANASLAVTGTFWQATQPVSGTVAATQSGTWTVQPGNTANTTAWKVDASGTTVPVSGTFWQATQPVSAASLPLPTGASTEATLSTLNGKVTACNTGAVVLSSGTVTTVSAVTAITNALPAGTNLLGKVSSGLDTSTINNGTTALTPKFAKISTASSGVSSVVAAVTSKKIRVLQYRFQADADVSVKFRDDTAGVDLTGAMATGAKGGGGGAAFCPVGLFETASGNALSINLSGAVQVSGSIVYVEV